VREKHNVGTRRFSTGEVYDVSCRGKEANGKGEKGINSQREIAGEDQNDEPGLWSIGQLGKSDGSGVLLNKFFLKRL